MASCKPIIENWKRSGFQIILSAKWLILSITKLFSHPVSRRMVSNLRPPQNPHPEIVWTVSPPHSSSFVKNFELQSWEPQKVPCAYWYVSQTILWKLRWPPSTKPPRYLTSSASCPFGRTCPFKKLASCSALKTKVSCSSGRGGPWRTCICLKVPTLAVASPTTSMHGQSRVISSNAPTSLSLNLSSCLAPICARADLAPMSFQWHQSRRVQCARKDRKYKHLMWMGLLRELLETKRRKVPPESFTVNRFEIIFTREPRVDTQIERIVILYLSILGTRYLASIRVILKTICKRHWHRGQIRYEVSWFRLRAQSEPRYKHRILENLIFYVLYGTVIFLTLTGGRISKLLQNNFTFLGILQHGKGKFFSVVSTNHVKYWRFHGNPENQWKSLLWRQFVAFESWDHN